MAGTGMSVKELRGLADTLFGKKSGLVTLQQEIAENFYPQRADFTVKRWIGDDYAGNLMTSYPVLCHRDFSEQISTMLRNRNKPWFRMVNKEARVDDAVRAAGGLSSEADRAKINLAAKVADGQKVRIPKAGETLTQSGGEVAGATEGGLVSINSGSVSELESLPAVGPVTAQKIISLRPYSSLEELKTKKTACSSTFY